MLLIERAVVGLLRLCLIVSETVSLVSVFLRVDYVSTPRVCVSLPRTRLYKSSVMLFLFFTYCISTSLPAASPYKHLWLLVHSLTSLIPLIPAFLPEASPFKPLSLLFDALAITPSSPLQAPCAHRHTPILTLQPAHRDQLYIALDVLRSLPSSALNAVSEQLITGIAKILEKDSSVVRSQTEWGLIIALFRATVNHPEASKVTLGIVQRMVQPTFNAQQGEAKGEEQGQGPIITLDNWSGVIALLDEFATAAGWASSRRGTSGVQQGQGRRSMGQAQGHGHGQGQGQGQGQTGVPAVERGLAALDSVGLLVGRVAGLEREDGGVDGECLIFGVLGFWEMCMWLG